MQVPDLDYLIEVEERRQEEYERALFMENYFYHVEVAKNNNRAHGLMNRREIHEMEKNARKAREYKKLKTKLGF